MSKLRNDATSALCVLLSLLAPEECAQLKMYDWVRDSGRIALPGIISVIHPARTTTYTAREREREDNARAVGIQFHSYQSPPHHVAQWAPIWICNAGPLRSKMGECITASQHRVGYTGIRAAFYPDTRSGRPQNASTIGHLSIFALRNFAGERMSLHL